MKATFERPAKFQKDAPLTDRARAKEEAVKRDDFERELRKERDRDQAMREKKSDPKPTAGDQHPPLPPKSASASAPDAGAEKAKAACETSNASEAKPTAEAAPNEGTAAAQDAPPSEETTAGNAPAPVNQDQVSMPASDSALDIANDSAKTGTFGRSAAHADAAIASSLASPSTTTAATENAEPSDGTRSTKIGVAIAHASDFRDFERTRKHGADASDVTAKALPSMAGDTSAADGFRSPTSPATVTGASIDVGISTREIADARHEANIHAANMVTLARSSHAEVEIEGMGRIAVRASRRDEGVDIDIRAASVQTQVLLHASRVDLVHEVRKIVPAGEVNIGIYDGSSLENASHGSSGNGRRGENAGERDGEASREPTSSDVRTNIAAARLGRVRIVL